MDSGLCITAKDTARKRLAPEIFRDIGGKYLAAIFLTADAGRQTTAIFPG